MKAITRIRSRTMVLPAPDIDTDQIIPARFLTTTVREGLGRHAFEDWRYDADGKPTGHVLNQCDPAEYRILVAGRNFGCGSSREHAPWALLDFGFRAVISTEIADIFTGNSLKNGLLPVVVDETTHRWLLEHPGAELDIDLEQSVVSLPDGRRTGFDIEPFARYCLMRGVDQLGYLLERDAEIAAYERAHESG
jgi:3-isopropylmalate/(R)-2-methylmalate dehydratase small subunit